MDDSVEDSKPAQVVSYTETSECPGTDEMNSTSGRRSLRSVTQEFASLEISSTEEELRRKLAKSEEERKKDQEAFEKKLKEERAKVTALEALLPKNDKEERKVDKSVFDSKDRGSYYVKYRQLMEDSKNFVKSNTRSARKVFHGDLYRFAWNLAIFHMIDFSYITSLNSENPDDKFYVPHYKLPLLKQEELVVRSNSDLSDELSQLRYISNYFIWWRMF